MRWIDEYAVRDWVREADAWLAAHQPGVRWSMRVSIDYDALTTSWSRYGDGSRPTNMRFKVRIPGGWPEIRRYRTFPAAMKAAHAAVVEAERDRREWKRQRAAAKAAGSE